MISFVYFDVGGVAVLDFSGTEKWTQLKRDLGVKPEIDQKFDDLWDTYPDICTTRNVNTLIPILNKELNLIIPVNYDLLMDGFVNRFEANTSIWPVITEIKNRCKVGLLTNIYVHMFDAIKKRGLFPDITWDTIIDSSIVGFSKPDPKIYKLAQNNAGVSADQILFVENTKGHVEVAKTLGWQTFLYDSKNPEQSSQDLLQFFHDHFAN